MKRKIELPGYDLEPLRCGHEGVFMLSNNHWKVHVWIDQELQTIVQTFASSEEAIKAFEVLDSLYPAQLNDIDPAIELNAQRDHSAFNRARTDATAFNMTMCCRREQRLTTNTGSALPHDLVSAVDEAAGGWTEVPVEDEGTEKWRQYGRKNFLSKGVEVTRIYYRCVVDRCPVQKQVERSIANSEILACRVRGGEHTHATTSHTMHKARAANLLELSCAVCVKPVGTKSYSNCCVCHRAYHVMCLEVPDQAALRLPTLTDWVCSDCKVCLACMRGDNEARIVMCDACDKAYHTYCLNPPLGSLPLGGWRCPNCVKCLSCGALQPGNSPQSRWRSNYTLCEPCNRLFQAKEYCPVCRVVYRPTDTIPMVACDLCESWIHTHCDGIDQQTYEQMAREDTPYTCPICRAHSDKQEKLRQIHFVCESKGSMHSDTPCCICNSTKVQTTNQMLVCEQCKMSVHESCYGVDSVNEVRPSWKCACCEAGVTGQCIFCGQDGGAFYKTQDGRWGHVLCSLCLPEIGFLNPKDALPIIEGLPRLNPERWKLRNVT